MKTASRFLLLFALLAPLVAHAQISSFQHVVVIVQENRTPDNLFQGLCAAPYGACAVPPTTTAPYDILTSNWKTKGGYIQPTTVALANTYDLSHAHSAFNTMCDIVAGTPAHCRMDGAAGITCTPQPGTTCPADPQFKYVDNSTGILDPYLTLATQYGWANYMFQTNQGPSFPAHQFIFGGTSAPSQSDCTPRVFSHPRRWIRTTPPPDASPYPPPPPVFRGHFSQSHPAALRCREFHDLPVLRTSDHGRPRERLDVLRRGRRFHLDRSECH